MYFLCIYCFMEQKISPCASFLSPSEIQQLLLTEPIFPFPPSSPLPRAVPPSSECPLPRKQLQIISRALLKTHNLFLSCFSLKQQVSSFTPSAALCTELMLFKQTLISPSKLKKRCFQQEYPECDHDIRTCPFKKKQTVTNICRFLSKH